MTEKRLKELTKFVKSLQQIDYETNTISLNTPIGDTKEEGDIELEDSIISTEFNPEEILLKDDSKKELQNYIDKLKDTREIRILKLRYGFEDGEFHTLEEIAHMYKVTRERIRQIENKGLKNLRKIMRQNNIKYNDFNI